MAHSTSKNKFSKVKAILENKTTGNLKSSAYKSIAHIGIAVVGGGLATAIIGKPSFLIGAGLTGYGFYKDITWLSPLGIGMMASSHLVPNNEPSNSVSGFDFKSETENAKNRLKSFGNSLLNKSYLDKVIKPKSSSTSSASRAFSAESTEEATSGFGSVQDNLQVLNSIEQQLVSSAMQMQTQQKAQSTQGFDDDVNGIDEMDFSGL